MYKNIISLGFNCSVAAALRRYGLRSRDYPFDWGVSTLEGVLAAVREQFADFLDESWIKETENGVYFHNKYYYHFVHDFQDGLWNEIDFESQMHYVKNKYRRKIRNFLDDMECGGTLFVRLIQNLQEAEYIAESMESIEQILRIGPHYNGNSIVWIGERLAAEHFRKQGIPIYETEIVWEDGGTGLLLDRNVKLKQSLIYGQIDSGRQIENLLYAQNLQDKEAEKKDVEISIRNKILKIMCDHKKEKALHDVLQGKKFIIYGAGELGMVFGRILKNMGVQPMYYLDKYKKKVGMSIWDRKVISIHQAVEYESPDMILIAIPYEGITLETVSNRLRGVFSWSRMKGLGDFLDEIEMNKRADNAESGISYNSGL